MKELTYRVDYRGWCLTGCKYKTNIAIGSWECSSCEHNKKTFCSKYNKEFYRVKLQNKEDNFANPWTCY